MVLFLAVQFVLLLWSLVLIIRSSGQRAGITNVLLVILVVALPVLGPLAAILALGTRGRDRGDTSVL